jgi:hypothetical protein
MVNPVTFFNLLAGVGMLAPRSFQTLPLFFLRPIAEELPAQMPNLFASPGFRGIGRATVGDGLLHPVGDLLPPRISVRTRSKSGIQSRGMGDSGWPFIIQELFYLYTG